jgi:hypothetical protein
MTHRTLRAVDESRAFEPTKRFDELSLYHVAFDRLNGGNDTEAALTRMVANEGRVAVIGPSGSGKSSLISAVLGPLAFDLPERVVPLRVPVATESDETVTDPAAMARHLVHYVTQWSSAERLSLAEQEFFRRGAAEATRRAGVRKVREYHVGLPLWLGNAEVARQVHTTGDEYQASASGADALEYLRRLVDLFFSHDLFPVFVFDDSDTWLRIPGLDRTAVATAFFVRTVRMITKELRSGLVMAVHDDYLDLAGYQEASKWLSGELHIPRLTDSGPAIQSILTERLEVAEISSPIEDLVQPEAVVHLANRYNGEGTIRDVLQIAQRALQHALSDGTEMITGQLIEQAIAELTPATDPLYDELS